MKEEFRHGGVNGVCPIPWCPSTEENGKNHIDFWSSEFRDLDVNSWPKKPVQPHECKTQECASQPNPVPDTDAEHELAAGAYADPFKRHNVVLSIDTGLMMLPETNACEYIFGVHGWEGMLAVWVKHFLGKQVDYGDRANDLGLDGQYAELHRKFIKLRRAMWEGHELTQESLKEVLLDLIGHGFLSLMYVENPEFTVYPRGKK